MDIISFSIQMFFSFAAIFAVCEFGARLSGKFEEINDMYNQLAWYLFPYKVQRMLSISIMVAQEPVELNVIGSISCGRITLKDVSKNIYFQK